MKTTFKITTTAPTHYQSNSIRKFGMEVKSHGDGSFTSEQEFETKEEAKAYLVERAEMYYDEFESQVNEALEDIEKYGQLTIDAVTACIEEIEEEN